MKPNIMDELTKRGLCIKEISDKSGVPYTTVSKLFRGESAIDNMTAINLYKIARAMKIDLVDFLLKYCDQNNL